MAVHEQLESVMASGRWQELAPHLHVDTRSGPGKEARDWYRLRRAHWAEHYRWASWSQGGPVDGPGALRVLAVAYGTPGQATKELARLTWGWRPSASDELVVAAATARGRDFCQPFLDAAARLTFRRDDEWNVGWVARMGLPLVAAGVADLPEGPAFGRGWAAHFAQDMEGDSLVAELRASPAVAEGLALALASPGAMAHFEAYRRPGRQLDAAVAQLVGEGVLGRERVLGGVLEALTRQESAHSQRTLARLLAALQLGRADVVSRVPLLLQLLATARGPVTAVLLPALIDGVGDEDLPAVAATIFARPEKAQRSTLLKALVAKDNRWGAPARIEALSLAAELPDQALAERAAEALAGLGVELRAPAEAPVDDLWGEPASVPEPGPATPVAPVEASMTAALSRMTVRMDASDGAMFWDAAVRRARTDRHGVSAWARGFEERRGELARPSGFYALRPEPWERVTAASHRELRAVVERVHTGVRRGPGDMTTYHVRSRTLPQVLHDVFASETTLRLGEVPYLLSTPSRSNGELAFSALVERLRGYGDHLAGPIDLFVALTRLEPVDPARLVELEGVSVRLWSADGGGALRRLLRGGASADAVAIVRQWVAGGGLPPLQISHRGGTLFVDPPTLPVPRAAFGGLPPSLEAGHEDGVHEDYHDWSVGTETDAGMLPAWADLLAAKLQRAFDQKGRFAPLVLPAMAASPRPGPAVVHVVAATLSHADEDRRLLAVDAALTLFGRGMWDPDGYTACCEHLLADGELRLGRLAHSWEQLILAGTLRPLWPTAATVLDRACALERKPPGLAELIGMLRLYVPAVPDVVVPDSLRALATSRSSSKAKVEAAAFVRAAA